MQAKEIGELLNKGAYDVFQGEYDTVAQQFLETGTNQLLEQSSRTVTYSSSRKSTVSSGLGSFSKAGFVASTEEGNGKDVDLYDTEFQGNSIGLEDPHESIGEDGMKIVFEKRICNKINVYDPYDDFLWCVQSPMYCCCRVGLLWIRLLGHFKFLLLFEFYFFFSFTGRAEEERQSFPKIR